MAKQDIYQVVTDRIIEALDRGTVPWRNPISTGGLAFPANLSSGKPYRGINVFLLATTAMCEGYRSAYWLTFRQAKECGGNVRKGEKSTPIVFFKRLEVDDRKGGDDKKKFIPMLKKYSVFNLEQIDGIEPPDLAQDDERTPVEPLAAIDAIRKGYVLPPKIETGGLRAYYRPATDTVKVPAADDFDNAASHACTFFHELVHSTGHSKRLDRGLDAKLPPFGAPAYGKEELVAECGSAFLCATAGILPDTIEQSAAYIDGWRKKIKGDKKLVVQAAAAAQRAADHILGVSWDDANTTPANDTGPAAVADDEKALGNAPGIGGA
jgi:antirestriction protein ArdC